MKSIRSAIKSGHVERKSENDIVKCVPCFEVESRVAMCRPKKTQYKV